jgi:hypothetical protein
MGNVIFAPQKIFLFISAVPAIMQKCISTKKLKNEQGNVSNEILM